MQTGLKIQRERIKKRMTQAVLAEKVGLPTVRIRQYECGNRNPKIDCLEKIAAALDVPVVKLRGYEIESYDCAEEILRDIVAECGKDFILECLEKIEAEQKGNLKK